jgi:hypothetical protein
MSTPILACPPADEAERLKIGVVGFVAGPDMRKGTCSECRIAVWIGPKARQFQEQNPTAAILCLGCAARTAGKAKIQLQHLGGEGGRYLFDPKKVE